MTTKPTESQSKIDKVKAAGSVNRKDNKHGKAGPQSSPKGKKCYSRKDKHPKDQQHE